MIDLTIERGPNAGRTRAARGPHAGRSFSDLSPRGQEAKGPSALRSPREVRGPNAAAARGPIVGSTRAERGPSFSDLSPRGQEAKGPSVFERGAFARGPNAGRSFSDLSPRGQEAKRPRGQALCARRAPNAGRTRPADAGRRGHDRCPDLSPRGQDAKGQAPFESGAFERGPTSARSCTSCDRVHERATSASTRTLRHKRRLGLFAR